MLVRIRDCEIRVGRFHNYIQLLSAHPMTGFSSRQVTTWLHQRAVYLLGEGCYFCACMISKKDSLEKPVAHVGLWKNSPLSFSATCSIIFNLPPRPAFSSMGLNVMHRNSKETDYCVEYQPIVLWRGKSQRERPSSLAFAWSAIQNSIHECCAI